MNKVRKTEKLLLCTDLDRTLIPNGNEPASENSLELFRKLANQPEVTLVYVTGRDQNLVLQAINEYNLPLPSIVLADVGSSIYKINDQIWTFVSEWEEIISSDWKGMFANDIEKLLVGIKNIELQESSKQNRHKLSYYASLNSDSEQLINQLKNILDLNSIACNFIWSIDEQANVGLLDVLPASAGKRQAIEFIMNNLNFDFSNTIFSGDSGNDICVMSSPIKSILVANANVKVKESAVNAAMSNNQMSTLYLAKGDYLNMNGNYSAGILEGVAHYKPNIEKLFRMA